ncbi:MAG TPA: NAD(P)H-binding protein [Roseiflexaceae bacterium]|nr:NAD(P)H-binding protein [Roseiflexaceae bacterium]
MSDTILITGASGAVGRRTAELLAERGVPLRLLVRDRSRAPQLPGAEIAVGDYANPSSLRVAFAGIGRALVVSGYAPEGERARLHTNTFHAAAEAGVGHLVYLSFQGAAPTSRFPMARDHHQSEQALAACGVPWTSLRDNLYIDLLPEMFDASGVVRGPAGDGAAAFVAREDVAQVAAAVLLAAAPPTGAHDVTGPAAVSLAEVAQLLSDLAGRPCATRASRPRRGGAGAARWARPTGRWTPGWAPTRRLPLANWPPLATPLHASPAGPRATSRGISASTRIF